MELKKHQKSYYLLWSLKKELSTLPLTFLIYHEIILNLGLSSWMFFAYLEDSFCEVYDKQYGEVQISI